MSRPIIGVDPSFTATGIATHGSVYVAADNPDMSDIERAHSIAVQIDRAASGDGLVVIESGVNRSYNALRSGYLHGIIRYRLWTQNVEWMDVPPATVKKYATGKGNAPKTAIVVAARERLGYDGLNDNKADALWLRQIGLALTGQDHVAVPKTHAVALDALRGAV